MKKIRILIISAAFLSFSVSAVADAKSQFKRMDVDKNGEVAEAEFFAFWEMAFAKYDKDKNGEHSKAEHRHDKSFAAFDKDNNGVVDADEDRVIREVHFKGLDKNQDGSLSLDEFTNK